MYDLENKQHFSLRKLSVGLASVLIGISFFSTSQTVKADTVADQQASTMTNNVQGSDTQKNRNTVESSFSNDNQVNNAKNNVTQVQNKTETKPKQAQTENIQQNSVPKTQEANGSKDLGAEKGIVKTSSLQELDNQSQSNQVAETSAQHGTLESGQKTQSFNLSQNSPKLAKKVLTTNLIATPPMTNGGFDEATWGKLDVNNWQGQAENGVYQLTGYTGDRSHVIVPNAADFEQAGKSTNGLQVGITPDIVRSLSYGAKLGQRTIAFSKTSNQKVKAIGPDWSDAFAAGVPLSKFDGSNLDVSSVTNMRGMFHNANFSDLTSLTDWDTSNVTDMSHMFENPFYMEGSHSENVISDLTPLKNWDTGKVTDMSEMFAGNSDVIDLKPIANWNLSSVKRSFNLFAGDSKLNLININNTPLMQGFLKMPHALQGSTFITNNVDLAKAVVSKEAQKLPISTSTATRTITFYIPNAAPEQTIQHIYYKTIAPVQIDWPIQSIGGGGSSSGAGSIGIIGGHGSSSDNGSSSGGFHYTLGGGGFSSGAGSSVVVGGHGSSSGNSSSSGTGSFSGGGSSSGTGSISGGGSSSGTGSISGGGSSSGTGSISGGGSASGTGSSSGSSTIINHSSGAPVQTGSNGPKIVKTYLLTDVKKSDWPLDTSKQNDDVITDGVIGFKPVKIIQVNGYKVHLIKDLANPTVTTQDGTDVEILEKTANPGDNIYHGVRYVAQDETQTVHYQDDDGQPAKEPDGKPVPDGTATGKTDQPATTPIPGGWKDKNPSETQNQTMPRPDDTGKVPSKTVTIEHDHTTVTPDKPAIPGDKIAPGDNNKNTPNDHIYPNDTKAQKNNLNGIAHRTITIETPDHTNQDSRTSTIVDQTIDYQRNADVDTVTGEVNSYGAWTPKDPAKTSFDSHKIGAVAGYDPEVEGLDSTGYTKNDDGSITINAETPDPTKFANSTSDFDSTKVLLNQKITVKYNAKPQSVTIKYVDDDNGGKDASILDSTVQNQTVKGVTDQTVDITYPDLSSKWTVVSGEQPTYKLTADGNQEITVHLKHVTGVSLDPDHLPDGTKNPENDDKPVTPDDFKHTVTRTVTVDYPASYAGTKSDLNQTVTLTRTATYDKVTGIVTWGAWSTGKFSAETPDAVDGYTPSLSSIAEMPVTHDTQNQTVHITYSANDQSVIYKFVDDDNHDSQVGSDIVITGATDSTVSADDLAKKLPIPENYDLVGTLPTSYTFKATNPAQEIHLKHHHVTIDKDHVPVGTHEQGDPEHEVTPNDFTKTITRQVTINVPTHENSSARKAVDKSQSVTLTRTGDYDTVTKTVKFGDWTTGKFSAIPVDQIAGYDISGDGYDSANKQIDSVNVTADSSFTPIVINYNAQTHTVTYHFVDSEGNQAVDPDGKVIPDAPVKGKTDDTAHTPALPDGWVVNTGSFDKTVKIPSADKTVNVAIKHGTIMLDHTQSHNKGDKIDGTTNRTYDSGLTTADLNQTGIRTITFYFPASYNVNDAKAVFGKGDSHNQITYDVADHTVTIVQTVNFTRGAEVDTVTGKVIRYISSNNTEFTPVGKTAKEPWDSDPISGKYAAIKIPKIDGYTAKFEDTVDEQQAHPSDNIKDKVSYDSDKKTSAVDPNKDKDQDNKQGANTDTQKPTDSNKPSVDLNGNKSDTDTQETTGSDKSNVDLNGNKNTNGTGRTTKKNNKKNNKKTKSLKNVLNSNGKGVTNMVTTILRSSNGKPSAGSENTGAQPVSGLKANTVQAATINSDSNSAVQSNNSVAKNLPQTGVNEKSSVFVSIMGALVSSLGLFGLAGKRKKHED